MDVQATKAPVEVTDTTFEREVLQSPVPVIVDFWAAWCGPCRALGPLVDSLATEYEGKAKVAKLNVDENPRTANAYGVRSIPTLMVFSEGKLQETSVGVIPHGQLKQLVDRHVRALGPA